MPTRETTCRLGKPPVSFEPTSLPEHLTQGISSSSSVRVPVSKTLADVLPPRKPVIRLPEPGFRRWCNVSDSLKHLDLPSQLLPRCATLPEGPKQRCGVTSQCRTFGKRYAAFVEVPRNQIHQESRDSACRPTSERGTGHNNPREFGRTALHEDEDGGSKTVDGGNEDIPDGMPDVETAVRDLCRLTFDTGRGGGQSELALWFGGTAAPAGMVVVSCSVRIVLLAGPFAGPTSGGVRIHRYASKRPCRRAARRIAASA